MGKAGKRREMVEDRSSESCLWEGCVWASCVWESVRELHGDGGRQIVSGGAKGAETWVSGVALWRSRGRVALRRCDAARGRQRCDAATLPLGQWRCGAVDAATLPSQSMATLLTLLTLRRGIDAATLLALWRGSDASTLLGAATLRRCDAGSTLRRCDAGAALRRCWRCDASFCKNAHGVASRLDTLDVYSTWCNALHQGTQGLNDVSLLGCQLGMFILHLVIASFWMRIIMHE